MKTTVIRQSRTFVLGMGTTGAIIFSYCLLGPYSSDTKIIIIPVFVSTALLIYSIFELITRKPEIILSEEGIEIRGQGWNHWEYVYTYWTIEEPIGENSSDEYLIVQLRDTTELKCKISNLEKNRQEIVALIASYRRP